MGRNVVVRRVGSMMVARESGSDPTDAEWDQFLKMITTYRSDLPKLKFLIWTDGGAADANQRKRLEATLGKTPVMVAVVSDSIKVRFAGATIALFQRNYKSFRTAEIDQAYEHLQLTHEERQRAEVVLREMEKELYPDR